MSTTFGEKLTAATPIATIGVSLLLLFGGYGMWWGVLLFGLVVVTPLVAILVGDWEEGEGENGGAGAADERREAREVDSSEARESGREDALDLLRTRYARGEIDDVAFERAVERLLATETIEDAESFFADAPADAATSLERTGEAERAGGPERETASDRE